MPFTVYILYSAKHNRFYVGYTSEALAERIRKHNAAKKKGFTRSSDDWHAVYSEIFNTKTEAMKREKEIKAKKSRKYIKALVQGTPI